MSNAIILYPGGKWKALSLSYDDGVLSDIRLIEIMKKYGLRGTFNISSGLYSPENGTFSPDQVNRHMTKSESIRVYTESGFEVSTHALTHAILDRIPRISAMHEIAKDREQLEEQFGTLVRGHAYPCGGVNQAVEECLRACGIVYARTNISSRSFDLPTNWLRMDPTCRHADPDFLEITEKFLSDTQSVYDARRSKFFLLMGHSYEFNNNHNWDLMETFAQMVGNRDDIWYCTNIEAYEYVEAFRSLIFSFDGTIVRNPSAQTIWFCRDGRTWSVAGGETLRLDV